MRRWDKSRPPTGPWAFNADSFQAQGLSNWWPGGGASGGFRVAEYASGQNKQLVRGQANYSLTNDGAPSLLYNGTSNADSVAVTVPATKLTLAFRMLINSYANADKLAFEYTANYNSNNGFIVDADGSGGTFDIFMKDSGGSINGGSYTRPSAAAWHDYLITFDRTQGALSNPGVALYIDGLLVSPASPFANPTTNNFDNSALYFMSRAGTSLLAAGQLSDVRLYFDVANPAQRAFEMSSRGRRFELWYPLRSRKWVVGAAVTGNPWNYYAQLRRQGA